MSRNLLDGAASSFDPASLKRLGQAFDDVWAAIATEGSTATIEKRRTRLALLILEMAKDGERDLEEIKAGAMRRMRDLRPGPTLQ